MKRTLWIALAVGLGAIGTPADPVATCTLRWLAAVGFSPDGSLIVTASDNGLVHLWDVSEILTAP
ncbi:MAG TPA: WD40 repeat domain-containing protein [Candidatus Bipolaricaulis anaerobius]|jgi:WD40 repeat protein|nr:WD40 repeat domain-containing protein [Candidatus Bipolaricaulis anaerobius]HNS23764.1 WD40 repeat domain-containing protein [Candidatus Bipolaricaulis anaerobius]